MSKTCTLSVEDSKDNIIADSVELLKKYGLPDLRTEGAMKKLSTICQKKKKFRLYSVMPMD